MEVLEERVDSLEKILARFMARSDRNSAEYKAWMERMDRSSSEHKAWMERLDRGSAEHKAWMERLDRGSAEHKARMERMDQDAAAQKARMDQDAAAHKARMDQDGAAQKARMDQDAAAHKARMDQFEREARRHTLEMAQIAERVGRFAEDIVAPNIPRLAREVFGITEVQFSAQRVEKRHARDSARFREFDMILAGQGKLIVVETKTTPRLKYIEDFAEMLKELPEYFPEWTSHAVIPIFASMAISPDFLKRLTRLRIYALALGDRTMELLNLGEVSAKRN